MSNNTTSTIVINNANFKWAKLDTPVNPFGAGDAWEVQLYTEDMAVANEWTSQSLNVKSRATEDDSVEYYVNLKRWVKSPKTGKSYDKPIVITSDRKPLDAKLIGNGSKGSVKAYQYEWSMNGRKGVSTILIAVRVDELIEYKPVIEDDFSVLDEVDF